MRAAVYFGSREIYQDMIPAAKSLLLHSNVEKIYLLIEDDVFPYELPNSGVIETINISGIVRDLFRPDGPNYKSKWTRIGLIRVALTKVFPELDRILSIDCDTIVDQDVSALWEFPLDDYYFAGVREPWNTEFYRKLYTNAGVLMLNLKKLREDGKDDEMILEQDNIYHEYVSQDVLNFCCEGKILELPSDYNACNYTPPTNNKRIIHYAAIRNVWRSYPIVEKYRSIPWDEIPNAKTIPWEQLPLKFMIHACPKRMWYVEEYLIPSMLAQGIPRSHIKVWNDEAKKGCLVSCYEAFASCTGDGATWHIQDDVILCHNFYERCKQYDGGVVYGFCSPYFSDDPQVFGAVYAEDMWNSFQCVRIPDAIAREAVEWCRTVAPTWTFLMPLVKANKGDDTIFHEFFVTKHGTEMATNAKPCLVDHVDWVIGGSIVNEWRGYIVRAAHWEDEDLVQDLIKQIENRA